MHMPEEEIMHINPLPIISAHEMMLKFGMMSWSYRAFNAQTSTCNLYWYGEHGDPVTSTSVRYMLTKVI